MILRPATLSGASSPGRVVGTALTSIIRSGGEKRLSDFLLWECAYAELCFVETLWPDFGANHLRAAIADFSSRERRFGGLCNMPAREAAQ
jgi:undecaprenyl diphosphate synthase